MLLSFAVRNFRCFVEEAELSLISPALKTNVPRPGHDWADCTERVAAIYGANASGKTTVLEALRALSAAVRSPGSGQPYRPNADAVGDSSVEFRVEFVTNGVRYLYEAHFKAWGVAFEALSSYPKGTRRLLFERAQENEESPMRFEKGASLSGPTSEVLRITKHSALFLATAHKYGHAMLAPIAKAVLARDGITFLSFRDKLDRQVLKRVLIEMVDAPDVQIDLVSALLRAADVGIEGVKVEQEEIPQEDRDRIRRVLEAMRGGEEPLDQQDIPRLQEVIRFTHTGADGREFTLPLTAESSGTLTWLTTMWHALQVLRRGGVLLVDEIDASLHPELVRYVVELFLQPAINVGGSQLLFTLHDVSLLGNAPTRLLQPRNVWFTEKSSSGQSELFCQDEFDNRAGNNNERRYLAGQFGAIPNIDDSLLLEFIEVQQCATGVSDG